MKEELYEKVVKVRRVSDRVMAVLLVFEEDVLRLICGYAPHSYGDLKGKWDMHCVKL